jgi:peptidoglycan/LPS O-acetylase OafA/YrhL
MDIMKIYYTGLDLLRFIAALGVVNFHYFFGLTDKLSWYRYGNLGVELFFIISGFVISQSAATASTRNFILGRFIRLYPLFWIACTITYLVTLLMPNGTPVHFAEYLISMTMLGDKLSSALGYGGLVDPSYWTLAVELMFYVGIGLFVYIFSWKRIRYFFWGWLAISAISFLVDIDKNFIMKLLLVRHASYFILGGALALYFEETQKTKLQKISDSLLIASALIYSTFISFVALPPYFMPHPLDGIIIAAAHPILYLLVILAISTSKYLQSTKTRIIFATIGGLTYPLYLLHQVIGNTIIGYFTKVSQEPKMFIALLVEIFMLFVAYIAYAQDKKIRAWLRTKWNVKN